MDFIKNPEAAKWVRQLNLEFGRWFLENLPAGSQK
jgi:hypothetical protein